MSKYTIISLLCVTMLHGAEQSEAMRQLIEMRSMLLSVWDVGRVRLLSRFFPTVPVFPNDAIRLPDGEYDQLELLPTVVETEPQIYKLAIVASTKNGERYIRNPLTQLSYKATAEVVVRNGRDAPDIFHVTEYSIVEDGDHSYNTSSYKIAAISPSDMITLRSILERMR